MSEQDTAAGPTYTAEIDHDLFSGRAVVRVEYRYSGQRRYARFVLVPDDDDSFEDVAAKIEPAITAHAEREGFLSCAAVSQSRSEVTPSS